MRLLLLNRDRVRPMRNIRARLQLHHEWSHEIPSALRCCVMSIADRILDRTLRIKCVRVHEETEVPHVRCVAVKIGVVENSASALRNGWRRREIAGTDVEGQLLTDLPAIPDHALVDNARRGWRLADGGNGEEKAGHENERDFSHDVTPVKNSQTPVQFLSASDDLMEAQSTQKSRLLAREPSISRGP